MNEICALGGEGVPQPGLRFLAVREFSGDAQLPMQA